MDIYDKSTNWKHNSWIVGLLTLFCFPFGLFLVWTHPHWRRRTKWIITGIFALCVAISGIVSESEKASIAKKLAEADVQWSAGQKADAVTYYKLAEGEHWTKIAEDTKPVILSRIVEFHADAGQDEEAKSWIATAKQRRVSLTTSSPKVNSLLATAVVEQPRLAANESTATNLETPATPTTPKPATAKPDTGYALGKEFQLGDYKYKIISLDQRSQIGEELFGNFMGEKASSGASFVVVSYTIENCTKESQVVQADDFKLLDSQGRTFDTSSTVSTALLMTSEDKDFLLSELQPGIARQMQQGFELPDTALESEVTLIVPQKGFFSTGDARLNVRIR